MAAQSKNGRWGPAAHPHHWAEGDIAFLCRWERFAPAVFDALIRTPGPLAIPKSATGHSVIVLRRLSERSDHVLVTTVSAYGSRKDALDPVAPWSQPRHEREDFDLFRSFEGSERANPSRPHLSLRAGQQFRKAIANWVDVRNAYVVPLCVLVPFATSTQGVPLQMRPESLAELSADMRARCPTWFDCRWKLSAAERALARLPPTPPPTPPLSPALSLDSEAELPSLSSAPLGSAPPRSTPAQAPAAVSSSKTDTTAVDSVPATSASAAEVSPSPVAPVSAKPAFWSQAPFRVAT